MIPLVLITGFLGSGKTTLLRFAAEQARLRKLVCIVNEFSAVDVDGRLLNLPPGELVTIPGGSIFCQCLVGEFIRVLGTVARQFETRSPDSGPDSSTASVGAEPDPAEPEGVIVEASGMADPRVTRRMLAETGLDRTFELRRIVSVVDPGSFHKLLQTLPAICAQIEASDLVLINKIDLYGDEQILGTEQAIRERNPRARIIRTRHARAGIDLFDDDAAEPAAATVGSPDPRALKGDYAPCRDPNYISRTITFANPLETERLLAALRELQAHVYRAKGFVASIDGTTLYVDLSATGVRCEPAGSHDARESTLVLIAPPQAEPHINALARGLGANPTLGILS